MAERPTGRPAPPSGALLALLRLPAILFRLRLDRLLGHRFLLLVTTGRRTGLRREAVLEVLRYDRTAREAVVVAGWGPETGWFRNLEAGSVREVAIAGRRFVPAWRLLGPIEAADALADYERRNRAIRPLVRRVLSGLGGFPYDGSQAARWRLAEVLPFVGLRDPGETALRSTP
jgi:deazaflavin-dependent oxidoreductase (nitroreductase family)